MSEIILILGITLIGVMAFATFVNNSARKMGKKYGWDKECGLGNNESWRRNNESF